MTPHHYFKKLACLAVKLRLVSAALALTILPMLGLLGQAAQAQAFNTSFGDGQRKPFFLRGGEGWHWGEDRPLEDERKKEEDRPATPAAAADPDELDLAKFADFQKQLDDSMKIATVNPSDRNVGRVLTLMAETRRKASVFTDAGMRVAALTPSVDDRFNGQNIRPHSPAATAVWDEQTRLEQDGRIRDLAKTHGIFFFYKSDCPYCHAYAPLLKQFAQRHGLTVFAVSMDGGPIADFPAAVPNNGIAGRIVDQLGISREQFVVPFTVLARPSTHEVVPVGFGVMNEAELSERIGLFAKEFTRTQADTRSPGWRVPEGTAQALQRSQALSGGRNAKTAKP